MPDRAPLIRVTAMPADTNLYGVVSGGCVLGRAGFRCGNFDALDGRGMLQEIGE